MTHHYTRIMIWSGLVTSLCLGSALSLPFWTALLILGTLSPAQAQAENRLLAEPLLNFWPADIILAGGVVGLALAHLAGLRPRWRFAFAGGLSIGVGFFVVTSAPFLNFANDIQSSAPLHIRFAFELILGLGVAAGLLGIALGLALPDLRTAFKLGIGSSVAAMVSATVVVLSLDLIGVRVGSGNYAMAKVVGLCFPAATITSGAVIGRLLAQSRSSADADIDATCLAGKDG